jgi:hypothetical protein
MMPQRLQTRSLASRGGRYGVVRARTLNGQVLLPNAARMSSNVTGFVVLLVVITTGH